MSSESEDTSPEPPPASRGAGPLTFAAQVLPPLVLAPLVVTPLDFGTILFWGAAAICLLVSMVSVVGRLLVLGFGAASRRGGRLLRTIRPSLTLAVVCAAWVCTQHSIYLAERELAVLATRLQEEGRRAGAYPEALPGWRVSQEHGVKRSRSTMGWTAHYTVIYEATPERDGFLLSLRRDKDTTTAVSGGLDRALSAQVSNYVVGSEDLSIEELLDR